MVDAGLVKTRRWVAGAVLTALCSLAYAKVPQGPHGGGPGGGFGRAGIQHDVRNVRAERGAPVDRNVRVARGAGGVHGGYNAPQPQPQRVAGGGYRGDNRPDPRNGFEYAGSITPVSAETRSVPRPPEDESMVRAGSIRADVARYNEERGASRPVPRPPDQYLGHPPGPSPYRN
jgi:hypothetical protein